MKKLILLLLTSITPLLSEVHQFKGKHYTASYTGCLAGTLYDPASLKETMIQAVLSSGATILDICDYTFSGNGYTMVILLSESHASIHTYPEVNSCFVDLFTCGDKCSHETFEQILINYLKPTNIKTQIMER